MSFNLSRRREAEVLGYEFIDPLESMYPLKRQEHIPPELDVEYSVPDAAPIGNALPPVPVKNHAPTEITRLLRAEDNDQSPKDILADIGEHLLDDLHES